MKGASTLRTYFKVKSLILIFMIIYSSSVFVRYCFQINSTSVYQWILYVAQILSSLIFFLICYFFAKKAAHYLEDNEKILKFLLTLMYLCCGGALGVFVMQYVYDRI